MTPRQRAHYFRDLWPAACKAQGWDEKDEAMRRDVTLEATGKTSTSRLTEFEITKLFNFLKWQADPDSLVKAMPVANSDVAEEQDRRRQLLHVVNGLGFADSYIARCAEGFCRQEGKATWSGLSVASLEKLRWTLVTRARQRDAKVGKRRGFKPRAVPYHRRESTEAKRIAAREPQVVPRPGVVDDLDAELLPF